MTYGDLWYRSRQVEVALIERGGRRVGRRSLRDNAVEDAGHPIGRASRRRRFALGGAVAGPLFAEVGYVSNTILGAAAVLSMGLIVWFFVPEPSSARA